ncbi:hypothetical protein OFC62_33445, partial [Escherichia coli]|nr:hypothetical protein [Escherichia coli]
LALFFCRKENNIYFNKSSEPHNCSREYIDNFVQGKLISTAPIRNINIINTEDDYLFDITLSSWAPIANSVTLTGYDSFDSVNKAYENIKKVI